MLLSSPKTEGFLVHGIVQPEDYSTLETAIEAVSGVRQFRILIDHLTRVEVPADHELWAIIELMLRIDPIPEEEPTP